jgi:chloramphenicol 3-O phosphotransferase
MAGLARMAEAGARLVVEDNFTSGPRAQARWRVALGDLPVGWVGIRCDPVVAAERERRRGDRVRGMAGVQALAVHEGIHYDVEVDTTSESATTVAHAIHRYFFAPRSDQ